MSAEQATGGREVHGAPPDRPRASDAGSDAGVRLLRTWCDGPYEISTDPRRLDIDVIHGFITHSYWGEGRSRERVERAIAHSLPFGLYDGDEQVGFARVITDEVTLAYLADVFVVPSHRGRGLGKWLVEVATGMPELQRVRRWLLATRDAPELYRRFGFTEPTARMMDRVNLRSDGEER